MSFNFLSKIKSDHLWAIMQGGMLFQATDEIVVPFKTMGLWNKE